MSLSQRVGFCPIHYQEFYVPHEGQCPEPGCTETLVIYVPAADVNQLLSDAARSDPLTCRKLIRAALDD